MLQDDLILNLGERNVTEHITNDSAIKWNKLLELHITTIWWYVYNILPEEEGTCTWSTISFEWMDTSFTESGVPVTVQLRWQCQSRKWINKASQSLTGGSGPLIQMPTLISFCQLMFKTSLMIIQWDKFFFWGICNGISDGLDGSSYQWHADCILHMALLCVKSRNTDWLDTANLVSNLYRCPIYQILTIHDCSQM